MHLALRRQLAVLATILVTGCVELGGATPPSRFYELLPLAEAREVGSGPGLGIGPVRTPAYLDRPQIVTRSDEHRLEIADFERWGEPVEQSVARVMAINLSRLLGTERVQRQPWRDAQAVDVAVEIDVQRFDGRFGDAVTLDAFWSLRGRDASVRHFSHIALPLGGPDYAELAEVMSRALAALASEIAAAVPAVAPGP